MGSMRQPPVRVCSVNIRRTNREKVCLCARWLKTFNEIMDPRLSFSSSGRHILGRHGDIGLDHVCCRHGDLGRVCCRKHRCGRCIRCTRCTRCTNCTHWCCRSSCCSCGSALLLRHSAEGLHVRSERPIMRASACWRRGAATGRGRPTLPAPQRGPQRPRARPHPLRLRQHQRARAERLR